MIQLTKDNAATPDAYSAGDGADPVSVSLILNGTGTPATISAVPATDLYVWADDHTGNIGSYTGIGVAITGSEAAITWELSLDGATNWDDSLILSDMDVSATHQAVRIYARATAVNDGSVETANYVSANITITATENPA